MRRIERTNAFRRDFKEKRGQHRRAMEALVWVQLRCWRRTCRCPKRIATTHWLANGAIIGSATSNPDVLLIYRKPDADILQLVRLGSHSELFD